MANDKPWSFIDHCFLNSLNVCNWLARSSWIAPKAARRDEEARSGRQRALNPIKPLWSSLGVSQRD